MRFLFSLSKKIFNSFASETNSQEYWDKMSGFMGQMGAPWRPSKGDMALYREALYSLGRRFDKALILGATPELRDLLSAERLPYVVADQSQIMIHKMASLMKKARKAEEEWLETDWETLPFRAGYFDLVLGDLFLWELNPEKQKEVLERIKFILGKDGYLITRIHFVNPGLISQHPVEIIQKCFWEENKNAKDTSGMLMARLLDRCRNPLQKKSDSPAVIRILRAYRPCILREKEIISQLLAGWGSLYRERMLEEEWEVFKKIDCYFSVTFRKYAKDYNDAPWYPIIAAKPK